MTYQQAVDNARRIAERTGQARFVVREAGEYHIATDTDLDTWFIGIHDRDILYCTDEVIQ